MKRKIELPPFVTLVVKTYLLGLVAFTLFRFINLWVNYDLLETLPEVERLELIAMSLLLGIRFDTVMSIYLLALPFVFLFVFSFFSAPKPILNKTVYYITAAFYSLAFFITAADVPYFKHFNNRLTSAALMWVDSPSFVIKMVFQEFSYWGILIPTILLAWIYLKFLRRIFEAAVPNSPTKISLSILFFLLLGFSMFIGMRGRLSFDKAPLGPTDAYFSNYSVVNQLCLNPVFTFIKSYIDAGKKSNQELDLMDPQEALSFVQKELNRQGNADYPLAKFVKADSSLARPMNVVLILMEGMSTARMGVFGNELGLTPFLDSLSRESILFRNIYSAGIHTHNGIYGSLTGYPALFERQALRQLPILRYNSLPRVLGKHGYKSIYFTNHDVEFDNVGGFLTENGIDQLVCDRDYPKDKQLSTLGVPDDFMFDFAMPYLDDLAKSNEAFLSVFMTTSNHAPFRIPTYYNRKFNFDEYDACAYSDWALAHFMKVAKTKDWYENTIFVFMADHGWAIHPQFDLSLNHSHVPLIFFSPKIIPEAKQYSKMGGQIDMFPSLMYLLNLSYTNNTLGVNLFKENRPYIYFNGDDKMGVIDEKHLFIYRKNGPSTFHEYPDTKNCIEKFTEKAEKMKRYGFANMQVASELIKANKVGVGD